MKGQYLRKPRKLTRERLTELAGMIQSDVKAELKCSKSALIAAIKRENLRDMFPTRSEAQRIWRNGYCS